MCALGAMVNMDDDDVKRSQLWKRQNCYLKSVLLCFKLYRR